MNLSADSVGASTACLFPEQTEQAFRRLCEAGIRRTEVFFNCEEETKAPVLTEIRQMAEHYGVRIVSAHPYTCGMETMMFFSGYERRVREGMDFYKRYYEAMHQLGAEIFVFHGNSAEYHAGEARYIEIFSRLREDAEREGVVFAQENVSYCSSGSLEFLLRMKAQLPEARFVLDTKQAVRRGYSPCDFVQALGASICHVHISDYDRTHSCMPVLGKGTLEFPKFCRRLKDINYQGSLILELYRTNFETPAELGESCRYMQGILLGRLA